MKEQKCMPSRQNLLLLAFFVVFLNADCAKAQVGPSITQQPTNQSVLIGSNATFSVGVAGTGPFAYTWRFNGVALTPSGIIDTVAGNGTAAFFGDGGAAKQASLNKPSGIALDAEGNLFIADANNNRIRKLGTNGVITTVAGNGTTNYSGDGNIATNVGLNAPLAVAVDAQGNLFVADSGNHSIRRIGVGGVITTVAGNGASGYSGDGGLATNASLAGPSGVFVDTAGNVYIGDTGNNRVRKVTVDGVIITAVGGGTNGLGDGELAVNASLYVPRGVFVDRPGNLYIADSGNHRIRKVGTNGLISTVVGTGFSISTGDGGQAIDAGLGEAASVALDAFGKIYIAETSSQTVRLVGTDGIISSLAGNGILGDTGDGGPASAALLGSPFGVAVDALGNVFIAESWNNRVRKITNPQQQTFMVKNARIPNAGFYSVVVTNLYGSVTSSVAKLDVLVPAEIITPPQNLGVLAGSNAVFSVVANGTAPLNYQWYSGGTALAGQTKQTLSFTPFAPANAGNYHVVVSNLYGIATSSIVTLSQAYPVQITSHPQDQTVLKGNTLKLDVAVSGTGPFSIRWLANGTNVSSRIITTVAGNGVGAFSGDGGYGTNASLGGPAGLALDSDGNLFIADAGNDRVRKLGANGIISTVAGGGTNGLGDGGMATDGSLSYPQKVAVDKRGNLFIGDAVNQRVRQVGVNGVITTVAGAGMAGVAEEGVPAINARLRWYNLQGETQAGVTVDALGNLFIAQCGSHRIRRVGLDGFISTIAGTGSSSTEGDGGPATNATVFEPFGMCTDAAGNLYMTENGKSGGMIRKISANGIISTVPIAFPLGRPEDVISDRFGNLFVAETANDRVLEFGRDGSTSIVAGTRTNGYSGDGGPAIVAQLNEPAGLAVDNDGNLFIADFKNHRIRKVHPQGPTLSLSNVTGNNAGSYQVVVTSPYGSVTSSVATVTVLLPPDITVPPQSVRVIPGSNATFSVTVNGTAPLSYQWYFGTNALSGRTSDTLNLSAVGENDPGNYSVVVTNLYGSVTSSVASLSFLLPPTITSQPVNQRFIAGSNAALGVVVSGTGPFTYRWLLNGTNLPQGIITTVAGTGALGYSGDGGPAINAKLNRATGVTTDEKGNLFIVDQMNHVIRKVDAAGIITTVAGTGISGFLGDGGKATLARLNRPSSVAVDDKGNLYIADTNNDRIRKVGTNGLISTVATVGFTLNKPAGVALDAQSNLLIADTFNNRILKVWTNGITTRVAGTGTYGFSGDGGAATNAQMRSPYSVAVNGVGNLIIADTVNYCIREVDTNGIIRRVAGTGMSSGALGDGGAATNARLAIPYSVTVDVSENLFIADSLNFRVRKAFVDGNIMTVAGGGVGGDGGAATNAKLGNLQGVAIDKYSRLFIGDFDQSRVRRVDLSGPILGFWDVNASNAGNYSVVISNAYGSVTSSVMTVTVVLPPQNLKVIRNSQEGVQVQFNGTPGQPYVLLSATNLALPMPNWLPVITNVADANGNWSYTETNASVGLGRFYRAILP